MRQTTIFLILISFSSFGQITKTRLINSQTNSYFFYSGTTRDIKRQQTINYFRLISADSIKANEKSIRVYTDEKSKLFIDSLKNIGFEKYSKTTNLTNKCKFEMSLKSTSISRMDGNDTIFQFILSVNLTNPKGELITTSDTLVGDKKQEIIDTIKNKKFSVSVEKINNTKLIDVSIGSFLLTNPYSKGIFSAGSSYSIYLVDKN